MKKLWELYITFLRVGGLTFGGGMAMLPMLKKEVVEKKGWSTEEELLDIYAIGQCTPELLPSTRPLISATSRPESLAQSAVH